MLYHSTSIDKIEFVMFHMGSYTEIILYLKMNQLNKKKRFPSYR